MRKLLLIFIGVFAIANLQFAQDTSAINIVPYPQSVIQMNGFFRSNMELNIFCQKQSGVSVKYIENELFTKGIRVKFVDKASKAQLVFKLSKTDNKDNEAYELKVTPKLIEIKSATANGLFYSFQTLTQLISKQENEIIIPTLLIKDAPTFKWRGFMLDEARYFKGAKSVKAILDEMARLKMNVFHWHLTDDHGWRIEIKKYPLLTEIGSKRDSTQIGLYPLDWESKLYDGKPHKGYYTQSEIREIVAYASERQIKVVPEIEMPGHASAAIASYPWLGTKNEQIKVPTRFGVQYQVYNVTNPKVEQFLKDVLDEVIALFPSDVIHIGGDEVKYNQWKESSDVQKYMEQNAIKTPADLQIRFINNISKYLQSKGKRTMGWNEITGDKVHSFTDSADTNMGEMLAKNTIVHFWNGELSLMKRAIEKGYDIVNAFHMKTYINYPYKYINYEQAYEFDPVLEGLTPQQQEKIIGLSIQMWGEFIPTDESMNEMIYPRIAAYAEGAWTPKVQKSFARFQKCVKPFEERWKKQGKLE